MMSTFNNVVSSGTKNKHLIFISVAINIYMPTWAQSPQKKTMQMIHSWVGLLSGLFHTVKGKYLSRYFTLSSEHSWMLLDRVFLNVCVSLRYKEMFKFKLFKWLFMTCSYILLSFKAEPIMYACILEVIFHQVKVIWKMENTIEK